jgi:predicted ATPase
MAFHGRLFKSRDDFLDEINKLFDGRKRVSLSDKNELTYTLANNNPIQPEELSSGEKQLLIILGEALLQQGESYVYITDEPELSLYVSWQETLTSSITRLNPNAQIVFATHSPDIVAGNSDKIINMEYYFK